MNICFISESHIVHTQRWLKRIAAAGHQVHLISNSSAAIDGVHLLRRELYRQNPLAGLRNACRARRLIRALRPDVIHLFGLYSVNSLAMLPLVCRLPNLVVSPWGTDVVYDFSGREPLKSVFVKRFLLRQAARITALSHFMTGQIKPYLRDDTIPIDYVPWGSDMDFYHPRHRCRRPRPFTIGITKSFRRKYGHIHLLEAVAQLVHQLNVRDVEVVMLGKGGLEDELRARCHQLAIDRYVRFSGHTCREEALRDHLSRFDVFVMPSVYKSETLGVAAIEASAMEIPVIASRIGGIAEVVENGVTGILTAPGDSHAIAAGLLRLYHDPELREKMGAAARRRVCASFDFNACVDAMNRTYLSVAGPPASGTRGAVRFSPDAQSWRRPLKRDLA